VGATAVVGALATAALSLSVVPADAAVNGGRSIEVFTGSNLVALTSYPANAQVKVEVLRRGFVIASATKTTDGTGTIEMNHVGAEANDCFDPPSSPDLVPRDTIRTTIVSSGVQDTSMVRGVWIDDIQYDVPTENDITVSGRVLLGGAGSVVPNTDVLELRINKNTAWDGTGRRDNRDDIGSSVDADGSWSHVFSGSVQDVNEAEASSETFLEWSSAAADFPSELTVAEFGPAEVLVGCPPMQQMPTAPQLAGSMDSGKVGDHITNKAANLAFAGLTGEAGPGAQATLFIDGNAGPTVTANAQSVYSFTGVALPARAKAHSLMVRARGGGASFDSAVRLVTVDATSPAAVFRSLAPKPLHLAGAERLRAVYRVSEAAQLKAKVMHRTRTVRTFPVRQIRAAGPVEYFWNGKNDVRSDVRPGRYRIVLTVTDAAGNSSTERVSFRVVQ
jgi:hypothetical protein